LVALAAFHLTRNQPHEARSRALEALHLDSDTLTLLRAGGVLARAGFPAEAREARASLNAPNEGRRFETAVTLLDAQIALAEKRVIDALDGFKKADQLVAPIRPRDFLARALEELGRREDALNTWRQIASKPELVWSESPDLYEPGLWSASLLRVADLSLQLGQREEGRTALEQFLKLRSYADQDSPQSILATKLLESRN